MGYGFISISTRKGMIDMAGGRPSKYDSHVQPKLLLIEAWARDGLTDDQIAHNLGIGVATLYEYKNKYPEFTEALKNGKEAIDIMVENALFKRAMGFEYDEVTQEPIYNMEGDPIRNPDGTHRIAVTKIVRKMVNPDTTAQIFWLKNRKPANWRDKQELEHLGGLTIKVGLPQAPVPDDADD